MSDETSLALLHSWILDSPNLVLVISEICTRDSAFAGLLLESRSRLQKDSEESQDWDVSAFLWTLFK